MCGPRKHGVGEATHRCHSLSQFLDDFIITIIIFNLRGNPRKGPFFFLIDIQNYRGYGECIRLEREGRDGFIISSRRIRTGTKRGPRFKETRRSLRMTSFET